MFDFIKNIIILFGCLVLPLGIFVGLFGLFVYNKTNKHWIADSIMVGLNLIILILIYFLVTYGK